MPANGGKSDELEVLKYVVCFTLTVAFRAKARDQIPDFVRIIRSAMKKNVALSLWFCEVFSNQKIIKEFFLDCSIVDMARFTSGLLKTAMNTLYQYEEKGIQNYIKNMDKVDPVAYVQKTQSQKIV